MTTSRRLLYDSTSNKYRSGLLLGASEGADPAGLQDSRMMRTRSLRWLLASLLPSTLQSHKVDNHRIETQPSPELKADAYTSRSFNEKDGNERRLGVGKSAKEPSLVFRPVKDETPAETRSESTRYVFKILQLADIHYGEAPETDWGPAQDAMSSQLIESLVLAERPDLVVLSGDQLTSDYIKENALDAHAELIRAIQVVPDIRWSIVLGNHDDHPYETFFDDGTVVLTDAETTREDILNFDSNMEGSYTAAGKTSTYLIPVFLEGAQEASPAAEIYIFDTGGGSIPEMIEREQVDWFIDTSSRSSSFPTPAVAFQHIASNDEDWAFRNGKCVGTDEENRVKAIKKDAGLLDAIINYGNVHFIGSGHNHGFSYCCAHESPLHLCFGRHSGYGGYAKVDRGGRVYELHIEVNNSSSSRNFSWNSWVRLEGGDIVDEYNPEKVTEYPSPPRLTNDDTLTTTTLPTGKTNSEQSTIHQSASTHESDLDETNSSGIRSPNILLLELALLFALWIQK